MTPSPSTDPAEATLSEALAILRSTWKPNLDLIFRGQYLFWLGSGISSSRFGSLDALLRTLLLTLQARCKNSADCPYRQALTQILQRTSLTSTEIASINFAQAPTTWPRLDEIVNQLRNQYSTILAIPILDPELLSIPWDVLKLQNVYSDDSKQPDAEHRCLAVMIEEGFLPNLISINWDPLIEKAHKACRAGKSEALQVVASNDDLNRGNNGTAPRSLTA